jgi:CHAP domain
VGSCVRLQALGVSPAPPATLARRVIEVAENEVGAVEVPPHSNRGKRVELYQASTGAIGAPWCVSFRQWLDLEVFGSSYADATANAYAYERFAREHDDIRTVPLLGDAVVYHLGAGHMGTVIQVLGPTTVRCVEGNEGDAVRAVTRSTVVVPCVFVRRPELHRHA